MIDHSVSLISCIDIDPRILWTRLLPSLKTVRPSAQIVGPGDLDLRSLELKITRPVTLIVEICVPNSNLLQLSVPSVNCFKNRLDKFRSNQDVVYNWHTELAAIRNERLLK